jgi:cytochrome P450
MSFEPSELAALQDPYPMLAALREAGPVRVSTGFWAIGGHAAALEVLRHPVCRSGPIALRFLADLPEGAARDEMGNRINFLDPPDHPRVRALVSKAFTPRRIAELRPWIETTADRLLGDLAARGSFDLVRDYAHQVPSLVISELLGIPSEDRDRLTAWSDEVAPLLSLETTAADKARAVRAAEEFHAYLGAELELRRSAPRDDLLSALLAAEEDGARLGRAELLSLAATLYSAGHRTTRDLFANGMSVLLADTDRYARVVAGEWSVADVVEEFLRYETPTLFVARVPVEPVVIAGVTIGAWEPLLVYLAAANRDPTVYPSPDLFQPGRGGPTSLSFAYGAHFCLGAALARTEAEAMLAAMTRRWPALALDPAKPRRWHLSGPFRGLDALVVSPG